MGCKQSKYAIGDESQHYGMGGNEHYKGDLADVDGMYPPGPGGVQTDITPAHRYVGGSFPTCDNTSSQRPLVPAMHEPLSTGWCPSDAQYSRMAENCSSGFFEMFSLGSSNTKMITNGPSQINAYQQPAYNYNATNPGGPCSEHSLGNSGSQAHSQSSQRRAVMVRNGSYSL